MQTVYDSRGVVGRGRGGGRRLPTFLDRGTRPPLLSLFWTEIRAKVATSYLLKRARTHAHTYLTALFPGLPG